MVLIAGAATGQEFWINPGETLVAIDGVPVTSSGVSTTSVKQSTVGYEVGHGTTAYAHALREVRIMARTGCMAHHLGVAPGTRFSGVGMSMNGRPKHCYDTLPLSRLVARAGIQVGGRWYWSAHYR